MPLPQDARSAGAGAIASLRQQLATKAADVLRRNPERAAAAVEVGLVDRTWLEEPGRHPISSTAPIDVIQRFLERSVEQEPSLIGRLGLSALQMLAWNHGSDERVDGVPSPVAIAFTDLEGFTTFTARNGDEAAHELIAEHHRVVGPIVRSRGGRVVKRLGDGLMLSFPSPEAALFAALELVEAEPGPLRLRAGVHCGEAVVTPDDLIGHEVNVAARVAAAAKGGEVLTTVAVRDAVDEIRGVRFGRARRKSFRGLAEPVSVCKVERA